jgi:ribulose-phosphate 3-epimerase
MSHLIAPSVLSANFGNLDKDIELINRSNADWFHLDIMDGVFVPNISFGFPIIKAIINIKVNINVTFLKINDSHMQEFAQTEKLVG